METLAIVLVILAIIFTVIALVSKARKKESADRLIVTEDRGKLKESRLDTIAPLSEKPKPSKKGEHKGESKREEVVVRLDEDSSGKVIMKGTPTAPKQDVKVFFKISENKQTWTCPRCEVRNESNAAVCSLCGTNR